MSTRPKEANGAGQTRQYPSTTGPASMANCPAPSRLTIWEAGFHRRQMGIKAKEGSIEGRWG
eukprot:363192-Chlamydomonas_euryale.AAC.11